MVEAHTLQSAADVSQLAYKVVLLRSFVGNLTLQAVSYSRFRWLFKAYAWTGMPRQTSAAKQKQVADIAWHWQAELQMSLSCQYLTAKRAATPKTEAGQGSSDLEFDEHVGVLCELASTCQVRAWQVMKVAAVSRAGS